MGIVHWEGHCPLGRASSSSIGLVIVIVKGIVLGIAIASTLGRARPIQGEGHVDFLGESEGSFPPSQDSFLAVDQ